MRSLLLFLLSLQLGWGADWPLRVSSNGHYLEDQSGKPFLIQIDSGWEPCVALTTNEVLTYMNDRTNHGFNAMIVNLIDDKYFGTSPYGNPSNNKNRYNESPFAVQDDFTAMNEAYWLFVDFVVQSAADRGILLLANPCYVGSTDGFRDEMIAAGTNAMNTYGRFIGQRFQHAGNILWVAGGDEFLDVGGDATAEVEAMIYGLKDYNRNLWTAHLSNHTTNSFRGYAGSWLDVDGIYPARTNACFSALAAYRKVPAMPVIMIEQRYENDNWGGDDGISPLSTIRRQGWWSLLGGCAGSSFGNYPCWGFYSGWQNNLNTPGNQQYEHLIRFFKPRPWHLLVPDDAHEVLTAGYGTLTPVPFTADYVTCARASDGSWAAAYLPVSNEVTIAQAQLSSTYQAWWYNPRDGSSNNIGLYANVGSRGFSSPDTNDWVLVLESQLDDVLFISTVTDQTIPEDTSTGPLAFTVGDLETAAGALLVSATSSNLALVPAANLVFGGSDSNRTVTIIPATNAFGTTLVTLFVTDGQVTNSTSFTLTVTAVNDAPLISTVTDQSIPEDTSTGPLPFTVGDLETAAGGLLVSATSSNPALVPVANLVLGGSDSNRTVTIIPATNAFGTTLVTLFVTDGQATNSTSFMLAVTAVDDAPFISTVLGQSTPENTGTGPIPFIIGDLETAAGALLVSATSSNLALVPGANLVFGGSDSNRTVTIFPATNAFGTTLVTLFVTDGQATNSTSFLFTVTVVNGALRLLSIPQTANQIAFDGFRLGFNTDRAGMFVLDFSSNFLSWTNILSFEMQPGFTNLTDTNVSGSPYRFYRVRLDP